ncbi:MAG: hypothetical protein Q7R81_06020 [Candidatus Peregrinibacteria bacterium]|nr:hypothetical protein [Candidatus Peregrinibacteria bacterium]
MDTSRFSAAWTRFTERLRLLTSMSLIVSMLAPNAAFAAERYWRGDADDRGQQWDSTDNWAATPTGATGASVPGAADTVSFDSSIMIQRGTGQWIRIKNTTAVEKLILSPTFTGRLLVGTSTLIVGSGGVRIGSGRLNFGTGTKFSISGSYIQSGGVMSNSVANHVFSLSGNLIIKQAGRFRYSGTVLFEGWQDQNLAFSGSIRDALPDTQAVGQAIFSGIILNSVGAAGSDDLIVSGATLRMKNLTITNGTFDMQQRDVNLVASGSITLANDADATLEAEENITASGRVWVHDLATISISGGTLRLNGGVDQILDLDGQRMNNLTIDNGGGGTNDDIIASGGTLQLSGSLTVTRGNLDLDTQNVALIVEKGITLADTAQATLTTDANMTVSGTILVNDAATITVTGGTLTLNDVGDQSVDVDGQRLYNLTLNNAGGTTDDDVTFAGGNLITRAITVTLGNLDLATNSLTLSASGGITVANSAQATFSTNSNLFMSGSLSTGAAGRFTLSGGTLTMNGIRQDLDAEGVESNIHNLTIAANSGVYLTSNVRVLGTLTINTSSVLTHAANTLYLTGATFTNNGTLRQNTGKLVHTGSTFMITNSSYAAVSEVKTGETAYFTLTDSDGNISGTASDTLAITVALASGDSESVTLTESAVASGIFRGSIALANASATSNDGTLQGTADSLITATYTDAQDAKVNADTANFTPIGSATTSATGGGGGGGGVRSGGGGGGKSVQSPKLAAPTGVLKEQLKSLTPEVRKMLAKEKREARINGRKARINARKEARLSKWKTSGRK